MDESVSSGSPISELIRLLGEMCELAKQESDRASRLSVALAVAIKRKS